MYSEMYVINTEFHYTNLATLFLTLDGKKHGSVQSTRFGRHLFEVHKNESVVQVINRLPKKSIGRVQKIAELRKKGIFDHNNSDVYNKDNLITIRRPLPTKKNT